MYDECGRQNLGVVKNRSIPTLAFLLVWFGLVWFGGEYLRQRTIFLSSLFIVLFFCIAMNIGASPRSIDYPSSAAELLTVSFWICFLGYLVRKVVYFSD